MYAPEIDTDVRLLKRIMDANGYDFIHHADECAGPPARIMQSSTFFRTRTLIRLRTLAL